MKTAHTMPFGAELRSDGRTAFRLWSPGIDAIELELHTHGKPHRLPMQRLDGGWHEHIAAEAPAGTRYRFVLPDGRALGDPAARFAPEGVHGPSEVIDPHHYRWADGAWRGRPWHEAVIYELHLGVFTLQGTLRAAQTRLRELADHGFTAVELMPIAAFVGQRGWGYDGVALFAPHATYGTPDDLKAFVDAAHALGLMVLLDVVYNHFGPEGSVLHSVSPEFFNPAHHTPWGAAIDFDGEHSAAVRSFFLHNALYWIEEFHFDGLRLDAVHAIRDTSPRHIACEIAEALRDGPGRERPIHVVLENDLNEAHRLMRDADGRPRCGVAQWNDDLHHAAHVLLTGEAEGYYADFATAPAAAFARALAEGYVYQGRPSPLRGGEPQGEPSGHLPSTAFVSFLQNHDQIGNRAFGERLHTLCDAARLEATLACLLLSPHVPMLFCGEEFAASTPFVYFGDFGPELAEAVARGRRAEFARFAAFADPAARERIPDPNAAASFEACKLRWDERERSPHRERLALVTELLRLRREHLVPRLAGLQRGGSHRATGGLIRVEWLLGDGSPWHLIANLGTEATHSGPAPAGRTIYQRGVAVEEAGASTWFEPGAVSVTCVGRHG